jgi:hypothetical protein
MFLNSKVLIDFLRRSFAMLWQDPRYVARKRAALHQDPRRRNYVYHRRDLMPKCVLVLVRSWFPNPPNVPYMGHMWE